jgi:hypothetical protein
MFDTGEAQPTCGDYWSENPHAKEEAMQGKSSCLLALALLCGVGQARVSLADGEERIVNVQSTGWSSGKRNPVKRKPVAAGNGPCVAPPSPRK